MTAEHVLTTRRIDATETWPLRHTVLRPTAPISDVDFPSDAAPGAFHAGSFLDGELVAVGTISPEARPVDAPGGAPATLDGDAATAWRVRGMATADWARSKGAGAGVLAACTEHARSEGASIVWCNARIAAVPFYEREGWTLVSGEFDMPDIGPHFVMERRLD